MVPSIIRDIAVLEGFKTADELGEWEGFTVYSARLGEEWGDSPKTGVPVFILLAPDGSARIAELDEMWAAFDYFYL